VGARKDLEDQSVLLRAEDLLAVFNQRLKDRDRHHKKRDEKNQDPSFPEGVFQALNSRIFSERGSKSIDREHNPLVYHKVRSPSKSARARALSAGIFFSTASGVRFFFSHKRPTLVIKRSVPASASLKMGLGSPGKSNSAT